MCGLIVLCTILLYNSVSFFVVTQQKLNICITFVQRRTNVEDVGPTLYKCYTNVLCLLGILLYIVLFVLLL